MAPLHGDVTGALYAILGPVELSAAERYMTQHTTPMTLRLPAPVADSAQKSGHRPSVPERQARRDMARLALVLGLLVFVPVTWGVQCGMMDLGREGYTSGSGELAISAAQAGR
jgi:hypothetical protein